MKIRHWVSDTVTDGEVLLLSARVIPITPLRMTYILGYLCVC